MVKHIKYLLIIIVFQLANAQTLLNESFSNFLPETTTSNLLYLHYLDTLNFTYEDQSGNSATLLSKNGGIGDSIALDNPFYSGGMSLYFDGVDDFIAATDGSKGNPGTSDFTFFAFAKASSFPTSSQIINKRDANSSHGYYYIRATNTAVARTKIHSGSAASAEVISSTLSTNTPYVFAAQADRDGNLTMYINGVSVGTPVSITTIGDMSNTLTTLAYGAIPGSAIDYWHGYIYCGGMVSRLLSTVELKELGILSNGWKSLNGGVVRSNWEFSQGVVNDTIYYNTVLTAGNWTITLSDSAASGVNYEVLTSADANTWTTLASGTTGTSWGSKSYSGTGTGYIAISVASGTAFFDDLVVSSEGGKKTKYNGFNGRNKY